MECQNILHSINVLDCYDIHITVIIKLYLLCLYAKGVKKEYYESMPRERKEELSSVLPSCSKCGAALDLKLLKCFGSRRNISDDRKSYYCNNPLCPPDEEERKRRLLPFSGIATITICSKERDRGYNLGL